MTKIVLVTGANKGIGFHTCRHLARARHTVLLGARDPDRGKTSVQALADEGLDVHFVELDVTDTSSIDQAAAYVEETFGRLDALINNAGITSGRGKPPSEYPLEDLRAVFDVNVFGVVAVTNAFLPLLRRSKTPRIGNVSSGLGTIAILADPDTPLKQYAALLGYNGSKAALNAVTLMYARELAGSSFRVNAFSPGFVATDLNNHSGWLTADEGGANVARQLDFTDASPHAVFVNETGGTYPW
jgi:NAD(P)-dependent dehydrogenase (short-subunit alcohol dehydrogenase family)